MGYYASGHSGTPAGSLDVVFAQVPPLTTKLEREGRNLGSPRQKKKKKFQHMYIQESLKEPSAGVMVTAGCQVTRLAEGWEGLGFT